MKPSADGPTSVDTSMAMGSKGVDFKIATYSGVSCGENSESLQT